MSNRLEFVCLFKQGAEATMVVGCEFGATFMGTQKVFDCQFFAVKFVQLVRAKAQWRCGSDDGVLLWSADATQLWACMHFVVVLVGAL